MNNYEMDNIPAEWAEEAVNWATENEIICGDEHGNLKLRKGCTREEMQVFLYRYHQYRLANNK